MSFERDKQIRKDYFYKYIYGWKTRDCVACNGSGIYDHNGSPPCGACDGIGKERYRGPKSLLLNVTNESYLSCEDSCIHSQERSCATCHKYKHTKVYKDFMLDNFWRYE